MKSPWSILNFAEYVIYVKKIAVGRYAAVAQPDVDSKKVRR